MSINAIGKSIVFSLVTGITGSYAAYRAVSGFFKTRPDQNKPKNDHKPAVEHISVAGVVAAVTAFFISAMAGSNVVNMKLPKVR